MKYDKKLEEALLYYQQGRYLESLKLCNKLLLKNKTSEELLDLQCQLLYFNGELEKAMEGWTLNYQINKNKRAGKYLAKIDEFYKLQNLFLESIQDLRNHKYTVALDKLSICSESSFNKIYVGEVLEMCTLARSGVKFNVPRLQEIINHYNTNKSKTHNKDKRKYSSISLKKKNNDNIFMKKILQICTLIIFATIAIFLIITNMDNFDIQALSFKNTIVNIIDVKAPEIGDYITENNYYLSTNEMMNTSQSKDVLESTKPNNSHKEEKNEKQESSIKEENKLESEISKEPESLTFPHDELKIALESKDTEKILVLLTTFQKEGLSEEDLKLYNKSEKYMINSGVEVIYKKARENFVNKNYTKSTELFEGALKFSSGSYLDPHILYFLACSYEINKQPENAIKYYEMYTEKYKNDFYTAESLYKLTNLYKNSDIEKAKEYATKIKTDFSNTIFNNSVIKQVLSM